MIEGAENEAANLLASRGDVRGALRLMLQADLAGCAARLLRDAPTLLNDRECYTSVLQALLKVIKMLISIDILLVKKINLTE